MLALIYISALQLVEASLSVQLQPVREDAALQLAEAMAESQKGYSGPQDNPTAEQATGKDSTKGLKKAELALRKCSPLTVSSFTLSPSTAESFCHTSQGTSRGRV